MVEVGTMLILSFHASWCPWAACRSACREARSIVTSDARIFRCYFAAQNAMACDESASLILSPERHMKSGRRHAFWLLSSSLQVLYIKSRKALHIFAVWELLGRNMSSTETQTCEDFSPLSFARSLWSREIVRESPASPNKDGPDSSI